MLPLALAPVPPLVLSHVAIRVVARFLFTILPLLYPRPVRTPRLCLMPLLLRVELLGFTVVECELSVLNAWSAGSMARELTLLQILFYTECLQMRCANPRSHRESLDPVLKMVLLLLWVVNVISPFFDLLRHLTC
jgi:hypothetical protein